MDEGIILITGANGFLGRAIMTRLMQSGCSVRATDLNAECVIRDMIYRRADITKAEELKPVLDKVSTVIHAAGLAHVFSPEIVSDDRFRQINEIGTANVVAMASASGARHVILISSVSVYGASINRLLLDEKAPCRPLGPYASSKYNAELRAIEIAQKAGIELTILRLATLYGEGDPGNVGRLMRTIDNGHFLWIGEGNNRKSLLYQGDAARACQIVTSNTMPGRRIRIYNVSGSPCRMHEIVESLSQALGKKPLPGRIPQAVAEGISRGLSLFPNRKMKLLSSTINKWLAEDVYDTRRFEEDFGFLAGVSVKEGLRREVVWYRDTQQNTLIRK